MSSVINAELTSAVTTKQPHGLYTLFFVEIWERFGFYCVQSLLVLFLTKAFAYPDAQVYTLFSAYSALIYATPIIGGYLADKYLGFQKAIFLGAILYTIGFFALATTYKPLFYSALAFLICGNGFFKSSVSSLLGMLYHEGDPRRDSGFTLFYMGINIGAILAPVLCSELAILYGWQAAFASAGIGMLICIATIVTKFKSLDPYGLPPHPVQLTQKIWLPGLSQQTIIIILTVAAVPLISLLIQYGTVTQYLFDCLTVIIAIGVIVLAFRYDRVQRNKLFALLVMIIFSVLYWAINLQIFSSVILFADRVVNRQIFNWTMPAGMLVGFDAFFIVLFAPLFAWLWIQLKNTRWNLSTPGKFSLGLFFLSAGFLIVAFTIQLIGTNSFVPLLSMIIAYLFIAFSELCLSPIGLSMITKLAPKGLAGMFMGIWFFSLAIGYAFGGYLANFASIPSGLTDHATILKIYGKVFSGFGWLGVAVTVASLVLIPTIKRLAGEK